MTVVAPIARRRFTVAEYERMAEAGVFGPDERIELLDGEVVEMAPIRPPHSSRVDRCAHHLWRTIATEVIVRVQNPLHLSDLSMPEPDVTVLRHRDDFYGTRHPTVADVLLLIEVGDTSARFDREVKLPLYATAAVVEVWLLDVKARTVSVCTDPHEGTYRSVVQVGPGEILRPTALPSAAIAAADLLG